MSEKNQLAVANSAEQQAFIAACEQAQQLQLSNSVAAAFGAVAVIQALNNVLTDKFMTENIMPLMNKSIGFLTDRTGKPGRDGRVQPLYPVDTVRDAFIDAMTHGLLPTGNQFNIIAGRMYPTKEGFSALLSKLGVKYQISIAIEKATLEGFANLTCSIAYQYKGEKNGYKLGVQVKQDQYSTPDQLKGKAERRAKKNLYEYLTGLDLGDGDQDGASEVIDDQTPGAAKPAVVAEPTLAERKAAMRERRADREIQPDNSFDAPDEIFG